LRRGQLLSRPRRSPALEEVVVALERELANDRCSESGAWSQVSVGRVRLLDSDSAPLVSIELRASHRPECRYDYRTPVYDTEEELEDWGAQGLAELIATSLREFVNARDLGLPDCEPGRVVLINA
jgi:hypothetical protein